MLNNSADVTLKTKTEQTAFLLAAMGNYVDVQKALVAAGANVNDEDFTGNTALILASKAGYTETVEYLLSQNADVHLRSNSNDTALMWAAFGNHLEIAKMLIGAGIDVNAGDYQGWTALMGASAQGHVEMVKLLLGNNANPSQQNILGHTALTLSSAVGNEDVSDILSSSDVALINQPDNKGMTPFVQATANNHTYAFRVLAYKCPNISISDNAGKTAMDYAIQFGNQYMINLLTVMANPTCYRFDMEYQHNDTIYQNCERLICHCTGVWKSTGIMDVECGKTEIQILAMQRAVRDIAIEQASRITS
ncbi:serine/threonine-protein phosphatase 6 regulatory ankyrin repeat subunit C-like [Macrobrachium nipponense]|uniref:serine/threonine-protein phosphatase 6 regulatory ankyrin repeat subunit C-like n=1 Tax=Macrobrachium nipponense TaxID=159736 RepID=UPI0030C853EA